MHFKNKSYNTVNCQPAARCCGSHRAAAGIWRPVAWWATPEAAFVPSPSPSPWSPHHWLLCSSSNCLKWRPTSPCVSDAADWRRPWLSLPLHPLSATIVLTSLCHRSACLPTVNTYSVVVRNEKTSLSKKKLKLKCHKQKVILNKQLGLKSYYDVWIVCLFVRHTPLAPSAFHCHHKPRLRRLSPCVPT